MSLEELAGALLDPGIPPAVIYTVVFVSSVLESFFPPWPTDVISLYAGLLAGRGLLAPSLVFAAAVAGTQVGMMAVFWLSRRWGRVLLAGPVGRYIPVGQLGRLEGWFARYGAPAIVVSRFLPGVRALVMPAAGLAALAAWKVWVFAGTSVLIWNVLVVGVGLMAGTHLDQAKAILMHYNLVAGVVGGLVVAALLGRLVYRRLRARPRPSRRPRAAAPSGSVSPGSSAPPGGPPPA